MTNRELFHATMRGENGDQLLHFEQGFSVPWKKWIQQGMPAHVSPNGVQITGPETLYEHFNVTGFLCPGRDSVKPFRYPGFTGGTYTDGGDRVTYVNDLGNTIMELSPKAKESRDDGSSIGGLLHEVDFAIKNRRDYEAIRHEYTGNIDARCDVAKAAEIAPAHNAQTDYPNVFFVHGPFAFLRVLLGTENAIAAPYEDFDWTRMMLRDHLETMSAVLDKLARHVKYDMTFVWEDCCGGSGPFMSPPMFDEAFAWWYREWKDFTRSIGIPWAWMDSDGGIGPLVTRWYESGIDCILPWEVNGVDMLKFAEAHPKYTMMGGIYKHMFEPTAPAQVGKFNTTDVYEAIDQELRRVVGPMRKRGHYFPSLDHGAFWGVDYAPYKYYCEKMLGYGKANTVTRKRP
ncbi:MAG: hypothetical protein FWF96_06610 [Kiritimatiellaeota bacterium]|nr:hypothetical protein [Kiritimatiellota bacterium]